MLKQRKQKRVFLLLKLQLLKRGRSNSSSHYLTPESVASVRGWSPLSCTFPSSSKEVLLIFVSFSNDRLLDVSDDELLLAFKELLETRNAIQNFLNDRHSPQYDRISNRVRHPCRL